ncbi:bis(5'-nucleosyl)-tetraphosphatase (symmetrical) YqeK [Blautia liquoris]|uniref:bis(5'-nucleosyl)-tetraphosphatase (symmetrical) n=1 Tax=Blautia liquoris TaxID=2779518 RepID=A0A7M2RME5_9FIRM|nr:bis(5'-nucleosyl)-tetraphosphatase (symmetrical) YqeK [Blautia liquoris]QOV20727.1 bis(5'-nucleosyl)-tetraphosphatase (symmetrical) YqeK [Blautia liquoris]
MESANYDLIKLKKHLKRRLDQKRFHHTIGVMYTAAALAMAHGMDFVQAETAGLLHDCAKCIPDTKKIQICERKNISITCCERDHPDLLHSKLGAYLSKTDYGITDQDILDAITWHTTGKPDMSELEKIIFIADYIEPSRDKAPNLTEIRQLAFSDLNECMYQILKDTVHYLKGKSGSMDETTVDAYLYYSNYHNSREE